MEKLYKSLDEVITCIKESSKYQDCLKIKKELDECEAKLNEIPIYNIYLEKLNQVNDMIDYVKDSLNNYFDQLLNKKY